MKFRIYDENNPPKERTYGLFMADIPSNIVNADLYDVADGDIFSPEGEEVQFGVFGKFEYKYLIARPYGESEIVFELYTDNPQHYYTEEDLKNKFVNFGVQQRKNR